MECYSCGNIAQFALVINRIDYPLEQKVGVAGFCCQFHLRKDADGSKLNFPESPLAETSKETLAQFVDMRTKVIVKGKYGGIEGLSRDEKFGCYHCMFWNKADWNFSHFIKSINLSLYPSPCQCRCIYCGVYN